MHPQELKVRISESHNQAVTSLGFCFNSSEKREARAIVTTRLETSQRNRRQTSRSGVEKVENIKEWSPDTEKTLKRAEIWWFTSEDSGMERLVVGYLRGLLRSQKLVMSKKDRHELLFYYYGYFYGVWEF